jgi:hypothetical protein
MAANGITTARVYELVDQTRKELSDKIERVNEKLEEQYVTRKEFEAEIAPIKRVVYGALGVILTAVITGVVALVINE